MIKQAILVVILTSSFVSCRNCKLTVRSLIINKNPLEESDWTDVQVSCIDGGDPTLMVTCPHKDAVVKIYFANEKKNILVVNLIGTRVRGSKYETPHGKFEEFTGPPVRREKSNFQVEIPREWFPGNVTRMSASVHVNGSLHNYYGLFNYEISFADTMVVEEYKKLSCCLTKL